MSIEGRIAIDVSFADTASSSGVQAVKKIQLVDTTAYATGKVAIVTGTVGTAALFLELPQTSYKDAAGNASTLTLPSRIAFSATGSHRVRCADAYGMAVHSKNSSVSVSELEPINDLISVYVDATSGTATYTLVLYGT